MSESEKADLKGKIAEQLNRLQGLRSAAGQGELSEKSSPASHDSVGERRVSADAAGSTNDENSDAQPKPSQNDQSEENGDGNKVAEEDQGPTRSSSTTRKAAVTRLKSTSKVIGKAGQAGKKKGDCKVM